MHQLKIVHNNRVQRAHQRLLYIEMIGQRHHRQHALQFQLQRNAVHQQVDLLVVAESPRRVRPQQLCEETEMAEDASQHVGLKDAVHFGLGHRAQQHIRTGGQQAELPVHGVAGPLPAEMHQAYEIGDELIGIYVARPIDVGPAERRRTLATGR